MTIRRRMQEAASLGAAIDARRREQQELEQRDTLGESAGAPLSSGGSTAGGGGVTTDPALPESFVTGLAGGSGNPLQDGDIVITGSGSATVTQDEQAGEIDVHSPDYTAGDGLDLAAEQFSVDSSVVRTTGNQAIAGLKTFSTLPQSPGTPTQDAELTTKDYVDERTRIVHRQVFPAAGSRDSISGNNEINLPWDVSAYPSGASLPTIAVVSRSEFEFQNGIAPSSLPESYMEATWTSESFAGDVVKGAQFAIACRSIKLANVVKLSARIRIVDTSRFSSVLLTLNDENNAVLPASPSNLLSAISNDTWIVLETDSITIQNFANTITGVVTIQGTSSSINAGESELHISELAIVQME